jgi:hypothetical protein
MKTIRSLVGQWALASPPMPVQNDFRISMAKLIPHGSNGAATMRRIPYLVLAGLLAGLFGRGAEAVDPGTALVSAQRPDAQLHFCQIIEDADVAYEPARSAWYAETNTIVQNRLTPKRAAMRDDHDRAVLNLVGPNKPKFTGWIVHLVLCALVPRRLIRSR